MLLFYSSQLKPNLYEGQEYLDFVIHFNLQMNLSIECNSRFDIYTFEMNVMYRYGVTM